MTAPKLSTDLMNYFAKSYESSNGSKLRLNRNTAKWAARDIIESFGYDECVSAIDWYFFVKQSGHDWNWYVTNAERLLEARDEHVKDKEFRKINRQKALEWLND